MPANAQLNQLDTLLLLALSSSTNLVISSRAPITALQSYILSFCARPSISRTAHAVLPDATASERAETSRDGLLRATFVDNKTRQLPQVLIAPGLDEYPNTVQRATYEALRDQRFTLDEETHNLPRRFVLVGIVEDYARMSNQLMDMFGLSLTLPAPWKLTSVPESTSVPPLVPLTPMLYAHPRITTYISDLLSATRHYPILHSYPFTYRCTAKYILSIANIWIKLHEGLNAQQGETVTYPEKGDIRPDDVRDIFALCVMHRLRYRTEKERLSSVWDYKKDASRSESSGTRVDEAADGSKREENSNVEAEELLPSFEAIIEHILSMV